MAASAIQPPDTAALEAARELRMKEIQMEAVLKEVIVYFFFVMVVFFLSYQARDADSFLLAQNIKNTFVDNSPSLSSVCIMLFASTLIWEIEKYYLKWFQINFELKIKYYVFQINKMKYYVFQIFINI